MFKTDFIFAVILTSPAIAFAVAFFVQMAVALFSL